MPDSTVFTARLDRVRRELTATGCDAVIVTPGTDLRYLAGKEGGSHERFAALVVPAADAPLLVVPKLEEPEYARIPTGDLGAELVAWQDGADPYRLVAGRLSDCRRIAVSEVMTARDLLALQDALAPVEFTARPVVGAVRIRKDAAEIDALRRAGQAIDRVHARMGEWLRAGRTERDVAADIAAAIVAEGHVRADFVIVGSGPNGASPHHEVSDRVIEAGDVVVVDIGGPMPDGYFSDSTRTYAVGEPRHPDVAVTYGVLQAAQQAAVDAVQPGVTAESVDAVARDAIAAAGFGEYFVHRTGHGIGLDVHESPYIVSGNTQVLEPGAAFSIEPGIYLPGRWGARIEDIVVVTETGVEPLNVRPHDLVVLESRSA